MKLQILNSISHPLFSQFWSVYNESFPIEEKRNILQQEEAFLKKEYTLKACTEGQVLKGFIAYWSFSSFIFIEHLAIAKAGQGKGLGGLILLNFIKKQSLPIVLEIEHPIGIFRKSPTIC